MIYGINGNPLTAVYSVDGEDTVAYNIEGVKIHPSSFTLKIMSYNVGGWYDGKGTNVPADKDAEYYALQNEMIARADPDVLCIQEYWGTFSKTGRTALSMLQQYFPYIHEQNKTNQYFGRCICSKYPISNYTVRTFTKENYRYFDSCTITVRGIPITFVNTHPGLTQENRDPEIAQLIAYLQTQQTFISCGDYNTGVTTDDKTSEYWIKNIKPYLDEGFHVANCDEEFYYTCSDYPDGTWEGCLDNIVTSSNITILSAEVDETKMYDDLPERVDHMPFIAEVQIGDTGNSKTFSVLGDSYSAFTGDVYPNTNRVWYDGAKNGVTNKDMMWYRLLAESTELTLHRNASYSGSPICYDGWGEGTTDSNQSAFVARYNDVGNADIIFVFGGTNDSWIGVSQGEYKYSDWTETDLESFRPALACLFYRLKNAYPNSEIIFIKNTGLTTEIQDSISVITTHYSVPVIELSNITKTDGHPTNVGMTQISTQVEAFLRANDLIGA